MLWPTSELTDDFLQKQAVFVAVEKGSPVRAHTPIQGDQGFFQPPPTTTAPVSESLSVPVSWSVAAYTRACAQAHTHTHTVLY